MDVNSAFRQVGVAPDRAAVFAYRLVDLIFVDICLQFGWRGVVASTIQEAHWATTWASAGISVAAYEATSHVGAARPTGKVVEPLPRDVDCRRGNKGERDLEWVVFFVVDDILLEGVRSDVQSAEHFSSGRVFAGNG